MTWSVGARAAGGAAAARCGPRTSGGRRRGSGACGAPRPSPRRPRGSPGGRARRGAARPAEATTPDGLGGAERHGAGLGGDRHEPVAWSPRRPPAAARSIDQRPDPLAVGEDDRGGPIPRREEAGRAAAQRGDVRVRGATEPERLGDRRQQGGGQGPAGRGQELERLVERRANRSRRRTGAGRRRGGARAISEVAASPLRPRTCSRLPRTVLISPLWAIERNGCARRQTGCVFVA